MNRKETTHDHTTPASEPVFRPSVHRSTAPPNLLPHTPQYALRGTLPNTPLAVSVISALLGGLAIGSLVCASQPVLRAIGAYEWGWARPQLGLYGVAMGAYHLWEFWTTAGWNTQKLSVDSFLLNNGRQYHIAHAFGLAEYFTSSFFFPEKFDSWYCSQPFLYPVVALLVAAQVVRSLAMIHANKSFSHIVKNVKLDDHTLITHGVYAYSRHPSYVGFFYWAIATQLLLGNIVSAIAFVFILARFFSHRIIDEEKHLVKFFGDDYVAYRKRVGTLLPFKTSA